MNKKGMQKYKKNIGTRLAVLFFLWIPLQSLEASAMIEGHITDVEKHPLAGATVMIQETGEGTITNLEGEFVFENLKEGDWTLVITFVGYERKELSFSIPGDEGRRFSITLKEDILRGDELLVTASLFERITRYQPARSYGTTDIQQRNTTSIGTLIDGEPGVAMRSLGQAPARPVVRGMDGERVQILQNGMNMGDISSTAHDHAVMLDPMNTDAVDIVRGPASLIYGSSAMGGIVNMRSADIPHRWESGFSGNLGSEGQTGMTSLSGILRMNYGSDSWASTARVSRRNTGNIQTPAGEIPDTDLESLHLGSGFAVRSNRGYAGSAIEYSDLRYGIPDDPDDPDELVFLDMDRLAVHGRASHSFRHGFWEGVELRTIYNRYNHDEIEQEFENGQLVDEDLELGVNQNYFQSDLLFQHGSAGRFLNGTMGITSEFRDLKVGGEEALTPDARTWSLAGYVIEELELSERWQMQAGVRLEWNKTESFANEDFPEAHEVRSEGVWAGALGVSGSLTETLNVGLQFSRAHRTPSVEELFSDAIHLAVGAYEVGNPELGNEIGHGVDLFFDFETSLWQAHLALFSNRVSNYITRVPTGETEPVRGLPVLEYHGRDADLVGGEMEVIRHLTDNLNFSLQADYIRGTERYGDSDVPLPFMPPLRVAGKSEYDTGRWWMRLRVRHAFAQNRTAPEEEATDGYTLTEINMGARLGSSRLHNLTLGIENLFDVTWRDHLSRIEQRDIPMMGRNVRLSYRYYF